MEFDVVNRRGFVRAAVGTCAALGCGVLPKIATADDRFGKWPVGIQSYSLRNFPADQAIRHIEGLGLHNVEFYSAHLPLNATPDQIATMLQTLQKAGIELRAHGVNSFSTDHDKNREVFEFAKQAKIRNITANFAPDAVPSLEKLVEEYDIRICIHNHGPGALYDKLEDVQKVVQDAHPLIGACVDTGHVLRSNEEPLDWIEALGSRVFALHLKDVAKRTARTHDVVLGTSFLKLPELFSLLGRIQFPADGSISLEYESNPDNPIDDIKQCLAATEQAIQQAG